MKIGPGKSCSLSAMLVVLAMLCGWTAAANAEDKFSGSNVDVRTILYFKVSQAALSKLVPPGWELSPPMAGPAAGSNLQVTFADQLAASNAAGGQGAVVRYVLFAMPVRKSGADASNLMIFAGLSPAGAGPYGTNSKASESVERAVRYQADGTWVTESWGFRAETGEAVMLQAEFARGPVMREKSQARVYSQVKPEFSRIYRYEQGVDVVRGNGSADHVRKIAFKAEGGKLSALFDGTEQLVAVSSVPWYAREIYLPSP